nr:GPI inositol-deacylase [Actinomycetes bacterium]
MTSLLYLHGVGDDGSRRDWVAGLGPTDPLIIAPKYLDLLNQTPSEPGGASPMPTNAVSQAPSRRAYQARQSQLHEQLQLLGSRSVWDDSRRGFGRVPGLIDALGEQFVMQFLYEEVAAYTADAARRRAVRQRVLASLPPQTSEVVVVGHSLGALVALDLLRHLPDGLRVQLLVTAASSLARRQIPNDTLELRDHFPYDHVAGWINVYNPQDPVTGGRPIGPRFPQAIDVRVPAGFGDHSLASCLADPGVARTLRSQLVEQPNPRRSSRSTNRDLDPNPLERGDALQLMLAQLLLRMGELYAADPDVQAQDVARFHAATELVTENLSAIRHQDWIWDHSRTLRDGIAESDIPTLLVRLVDVQPLDYLRLQIPENVDRQARIQVALDLGVPPLWLDLARSAQQRAESVVGASRA